MELSPDHTGPPSAADTGADVDDHPTSLADGPVSGRRLAIAAIVYVAITFALGLVLGLLGVTFESNAGVLAFLTVSAVAPIVAVWTAVRWPRSLTWEIVGVRPVSAGWLALGGVAGVGTLLVNIAWVWLYSTIVGEPSIPLERVALAEAFDGPLWQSLLLLALGGALAPLGEELLFRGVVFGWLSRWPVSAAVLGSALIFAAAHGFTVVFPVAVVLGIATAVVYHRSGSIWPAMALHVVNNSAALGAVLVSQ